MNKNKLVDIWRILNRDKRQFTWFKPNGQTKSRIDYWLVLKHVTETNISNSPLSDHCIINLKRTNDETNKSKGYWKCNANLLTNEVYCTNIKQIILEVKNDNNVVSSIQEWEYLKFLIRKHSITFKKNNHNNICLVLDLIDYGHLTDDDGFMLFLDFCMHTFILAFWI